MQSPWRQFWHPKYWLFFPCFLFLRFIIYLPYRLQMHIGQFLGLVLLQFDSKGRHTTETNLALCFPELSPRQRKNLLYKNYQSLGISIIETAMAWFAQDNKLPPLEIQGLEKWKTAQKKNRGVLLVSAHFGSLEICARLLKNKLPLTGIYRHQKLKLLDHFTKYYRNKNVPKLIAREDLRQLIRALQQGESIWYTPDIDAGSKNSIFVPFFNIPTATITTCSRFAQHTNCAVMTFFFHRKKDLSGYEIILDTPFQNFPSHDPVADATKINKVIEAAIRKNPDQYLWQYKRFKTRPVGEKRFYRRH